MVLYNVTKTAVNVRVFGGAFRSARPDGCIRGLGERRGHLEERGGRL